MNSVCYNQNKKEVMNMTEKRNKIQKFLENLSDENFEKYKQRRCKQICDSQCKSIIESVEKTTKEMILNKLENLSDEDVEKLDLSVWIDKVENKEKILEDSFYDMFSI
jgi:hypothetical protein